MAAAEGISVPSYNPNYESTEGPTVGMKQRTNILYERDDAFGRYTRTIFIAGMFYY